MRRLLVLAATLAIPFTPAPPRADAASIAGEWRGQVERDGHRWNVRVHVSKRGPVHEVKVSLPDWGMFLLETDSLSVKGNALRFSTAWVENRFEGRVTRDSLKGVWTSREGPAAARLARVSVDPGMLRTDTMSVVTDDGARLAGTLILPDGVGPFPAMLLTHGSGRDTRRTGPYVSKANLAAMNGIAVLVYDKRGAGQSTGEGEHEQGRLARDAKAMLAWLRADSRIDSGATGVGGASQGAWLAAQLAAEDPAVAFVFTVAAPGLTASEQNVYSMQTRMAARGRSDADIHDAKRALRALYDFYRTSAPAERERAVRLITEPDPDWSSDPIFQRLMFAPNGSVYEQVDAGAWSSMFRDPLAWWREITVPVVALWGEEDINLPAGYSRAVIEAALEEAGNRDRELRVFPGAGHGVMIEHGPENDWPRMAPGYVEAMASWFARRAGRQAPRW